jgi:hypothetical protein
MLRIITVFSVMYEIEIVAFHIGTCQQHSCLKAVKPTCILNLKFWRWLLESLPQARRANQTHVIS